MKQQEVFNKIGGILKELNEQYEYLKTVDEPLNELELELFLANSHFLTDHMIILSKLNAQAIAANKTREKEPEAAEQKKVEAPEPVKAAEEKYFEPLVQSAAPAKNGAANRTDETPAPKIDLGSNTFEDSYSFIRDEEPETIRHELILDESDFDEDDDVAGDTPGNTVVEKVPQPEPAATAKHETKPVAEKPAPKPVYEHVKEEVLTINQKISAQLGERNGVAEQLILQPVSDLKGAINLNDKLLYVKDLFNGYSLAYSEAIEILNRFASFEEADLFLKKNYVAKNNWDSKPETTAKFYSLLKRRYA